MGGSDMWCSPFSELSTRLNRLQRASGCHVAEEQELLWGGGSEKWQWTKTLPPRPVSSREGRASGMRSRTRAPVRGRSPAPGPDAPTGVIIKLLMRDHFQKKVEILRTG